jgi:hypothetical protein
MEISARFNVLASMHLPRYTILAAAVPRLHAVAMSALFPSNAIPTPLSDVLRLWVIGSGNRYLFTSMELRVE